MGRLLCLASAACFATTAVFAKLAYAEGVSVQTLLVLRFLSAAVLLGVLAAVAAVRRRRAAPAQRAAAPAARSTALFVVVVGGGAYAASAVLFFSSLQHVAAPAASLVLYAYPAMVTAAVVALGRERLSVRRCAAVVVAGLGTLLVLGSGGSGVSVRGACLALGSAVAYTVYVLACDGVVERSSPTAVAALVMTGSAATCSVVAGVSGGVALDLTWRAWLWVGCTSVVATVVAVLLFVAGLRRAGAAGAAVLSTVEPVVTAVLAAVVLGEVLSWSQIAGGVVVLCSVLLAQARRRQPARPVAGGARTGAGADGHLRAEDAAAR